MNTKDLMHFVDIAGRATYAGGGKKEIYPERKDFTEMIYQEGDFYYRDSWTGYVRSRGMELVRYKKEPVWSCLYGGGMVEGYEALTDECFDFLKKALMAKETNIASARGPKQYTEGDWSYNYTQEGDKTEFSGYEQIHHKGELVFFHRVIGGIIKHGIKQHETSTYRCLRDFIR